MHAGDLTVGTTQHGEDVHIDSEHDEHRSHHEHEEAHVDVVAQIDDQYKVAHSCVVPAEIPPEQRNEPDENAGHPVDS